MVLDDIPDDSILIKVSTSSIRTKGLLESQHDALHMVTIPHLFHPDVSEAHHHKVLCHLLSKVVINTEQVGLVKVLSQLVKDVLTAIQIAPKWLLDNHTAPSVRSHTIQLNRLSGFSENIRRNGKVEKTIGLLFPLDLPELAIERLPSLDITVSTSRLVKAPGQEFIHNRFILLLDQEGTEAVAQCLVSHIGSSESVDDDIFREKRAGVKAEEGGIGLLLR
mmetsp:Transcript_3908/g.7445  ORF Transcript_3908/g.7445 Transcript_3908/m.7445 type:complete len:221 (-) Transcript_3908:294-956(-)